MSHLKNKKILIVDDEDVLREILKECFEIEGSIVVEAQDGEIALKCLKQETFDIVLSDISMPNKDGLTLLKEVRVELSYQPVFYVYTGFTDLSPQQFIKLGADGFFAKPFELNQILDKINLDLQNKKINPT
jgi:two-component system response regulator (stage 0 sporulation protein F)